MQPSQGVAAAAQDFHLTGRSSRTLREQGLTALRQLASTRALGDSEAIGSARYRLSLHSLDRVIQGDLDELFDALAAADMPE